MNRKRFRSFISTHDKWEWKVLHVYFCSVHIRLWGDCSKTDFNMFLSSCITILPINIIKDTFSGIPPTVYHNNMIAQTKAAIFFTSRTSVPRSLPSFPPTSPDRGLLAAAGLQDLCLWPCPIPQPSAGHPMWRLPPPGPLSAPWGCSCLKRASPVWTRAIQPASSVSPLTSTSSTTRRPCTGK